jgi:hypothetical protein
MVLWGAHQSSIQMEDGLSLVMEESTSDVDMTSFLKKKLHVKNNIKRGCI